MTGLSGHRIVVTRRRQQSSTLVDGLRARGATVIEIPAIEVAAAEDTAPLDRALRNAATYGWIAFTSANAVRFVAERMTALGLTDLPPVASVGPATTDACRDQLRVEPVLVPATDFRAEGLLAAFAERAPAGRRILLPVSDRARDTLAAGLTGLGAQVDRVTAYRTVASSDLAGALASLRAQPPDLMVFASPSAVESFVAAAGESLGPVPVAVIGPVTEQAARDAGMTVAIVAQPSTAEGLLAAIDVHFSGPVPPPRV